MEFHVKIGIKIRFLHFRNGVSFETINGKMSSVTEDCTEMTAPWNETKLPNYKLEIVFNADEFGLFYQCLPIKTYYLSQEKCFGRKNSKFWLTEWQLQAQLGKNYPCLLLTSPKHHNALKILRNSLVDIEARRKVGWLEIFLESG